MDIVVRGKSVSPTNARVSDVTQLRRWLIARTDALVNEESPESLQRLQGIHRALGGAGEAIVDKEQLVGESRKLSSEILTSSRRDGSHESLYEAAQKLNHGLRIARGEILVPELSSHQRGEIILGAKELYQVQMRLPHGKSAEIVDSFVIPAGASAVQVCADLVTGCKAVQRDRLAVEMDNFSWIGRHGTTPLSDGALRVVLGPQILEAANRTIDDQKRIAADMGYDLPSRQIATIAHSLAYLLTNASLFDGQIARISTGTGLRFGDRGLSFEYGEKVNRFSHVFPVRLERA